MLHDWPPVTRTSDLEHDDMAYTLQGWCKNISIKGLKLAVIGNVLGVLVAINISGGLVEQLWTEQQ